MKKVEIIGIGMGNPDTITVGGLRKIKEADFVIGAKRMVDAFDFAIEKKPKAYAIKSTEIYDAIKERKDDETIAVLMSGDAGFFSGTKKLIDLLKGQVSYRITPGVSSLQYFAAKTGVSWDDVKTISLHGRVENPVSNVLTHLKTFFLLDSNMNAAKVCQELKKADLGHLEVIVGERLSYEDEKFTYGTAEELANLEFDNLSVILVFNPDARRLKIVTHGLSDEEFIRGDVPMTKSEIRSISLSKLEVRKRDIVYDIGAGTGSVTVELARQVFEGRIFAVEINHDAAKLIDENISKFNLQNVKVIEGKAPEAIMDLPAPDRVFIGGSKGNMDEIIKTVLDKNKDARIVINAIALETVAASLEVIKKYQLKNVEIVQASIAKARKIGSYNMMNGQNPVYIISAGGK